MSYPHDTPFDTPLTLSSSDSSRKQQAAISDDAEDNSSPDCADIHAESSMLVYGALSDVQHILCVLYCR
jgi:hypothetical protein